MHMHIIAKLTTLSNATIVQVSMYRYYHDFYVADELARNMACSMHSALLEYGHSKIASIIQHLIDEGIITKNNRVVKRKVFIKTLELDQFSFGRFDLVSLGLGYVNDSRSVYYLYFQMMEAFNNLDCLESVSHRAVVFSKLIYEFPGVEYPFQYKRTLGSRPCNAEGKY
jgi:hypothetical protein